MLFHTAAQCCNEIEELLRIAELPSRDALLRLMVVEQRLRLDFCTGDSLPRLRSLIDAIERFWTVEMFPPVEGESTMLQSAALREIEALRQELGRGLNRLDAGPANVCLLAA